MRPRQLATGPTAPWPTRLASASLRWTTTLLGKKVRPIPLESSESYPKRLLIIKVHGMGDSVLIRSFMERLRRTYPDLTVGVLVGKASEELMTLGMNVRRHIYSQSNFTPSSVMRMRRALKRESYDAVLNFEQASLAGTAFVSTLGIKTHVGFVSSEDDPKAVFLSHWVTLRQWESMWESILRLGRMIYPELQEGPPSMDLQPADEAIKWADRWWQDCVGEKRFAIALHLGSGPGMPYRKWPLSNFVGLAKRLMGRRTNLVFVLTGTNTERDLIQTFRKCIPEAAIDASELGSLERTALILRRCRLLVSNDTGVMHLGSAVGTPTIGLFGPSSPVHWKPLGRHSSYVRDTTLHCSPCINNYLNIVPLKCSYPVQSQCMLDISVSSVERAIENMFCSVGSNFEVHPAV